jgi:ubiquinone/menaquinone biosynthesis C-methylase UbiE
MANDKQEQIDVKKKILDAYKLHYTTETTSLIEARYHWVIDNYFRNINDTKILEIGSGDGGVIQFLKTNNDVYGLDASESGIEICNKKAIKACLFDASIDTIPFEDNYFDSVICLETLEHLENPQHCLEEIKRVLKPGKHLIVSIPNPRTRHKFIYPCLFKFGNFMQYIRINNFEINNFKAWGYIPFFINFKTKLLNNFYMNHGFQFIMRKLFGHRLTYFWAWCWVFDIINQKSKLCTSMAECIASETKHQSV